jgi:hypothetical protein
MMAELILVDELVVAFSGDHAGEGPLTVGQLNTLQWLGNGSLYTSVDWVLDLPDGVGLADITESVAVLLGRHESLRTTFTAGAATDEPRQRVISHGELAVAVYRADGEDDPAVVTQRLTERLQATPFRLDDQLPVRVGVAVRDDRPLTAVIVGTHLAADCGSLMRLGEQFAELVRHPDRRVVGPRGHQPLDQAAQEHTPAGQRRLASTLEHWRRLLLRMPQCLYAAPVVDRDAGGPLTGFLESPAVARALPLVAARTGASRPMVLLAAYGALLARRTGEHDLAFATVVHNRVGAHLHDYIGTLAQDSLLAFDAATSSFDELVRRVGAATIAANRYGMFRADRLRAVQREAGQARGTFFQRDCAVNIMGFAGDPAPAASDADARATARAVEQAVAALGESRLRWWEPPSFRVMLLLRVVDIGGDPVLGLTTDDTSRVPASELSAMLYAMEALVVAAAAGDVDLSRDPALSAIPPLRRGSEWLRVGASWVEWPAVRRLVDDALGEHGARVFALPAGPDRADLVAYLVADATMGTPEQAHAACMTAVERSFMAVTPGYYVLCGSAPDDPADLAAWRARPVVAQGDGRPATRPAATPPVEPAMSAGR